MSAPRYLRRPPVISTSAAICAQSGCSRLIRPWLMVTIDRRTSMRPEWPAQPPSSLEPRAGPTHASFFHRAPDRFLSLYSTRQWTNLSRILSASASLKTRRKRRQVTRSCPRHLPNSSSCWAVHLWSGRPDVCFTIWRRCTSRAPMF